MSIILNLLIIGLVLLIVALARTGRGAAAADGADRACH